MTTEQDQLLQPKAESARGEMKRLNPGSLTGKKRALSHAKEIGRSTFNRSTLKQHSSDYLRNLLLLKNVDSPQQPLPFTLPRSAEG